MPVSRHNKRVLLVVLSGLSLLTAAFFIGRSVFLKTTPNTVAQVSAPAAQPEPLASLPGSDAEPDAVTDDHSCQPESTFGEGVKSKRVISPDLQFKASIATGDRVNYTLPFALKPQTFVLKYEDENSSHETAQCLTEGQTVRCTEVFSNAADSYCGPLKLADGSEKFVQFYLELKERPAPLPADLEKYAIKKEAHGLGVFMQRLQDPVLSASRGLPAYRPIQVWESSDPAARMIGEVPSGFFLMSEYSDAVYIEKVGDRYLTNLLATQVGNSVVPPVYHWISNVQAQSYDDIVREGGIFCLNFIQAYCKNPSEKDCQNQEDVIKDFDRDNFEVDKAQPILRNEGDWVVLKPKPDKAAGLPTLYVRLKEYYQEATIMCD